MSKTLTREEGLFVSAIHAAEIDEPMPRATWALYLLCAVVAAGIAWSALAHVDEITRSDGRIVPDGREQVIASLDAGILHELKVREGQEVQAGQVLVEGEDMSQLDGQALRAAKAIWARLSESCGVTRNVQNARRDIVGVRR